MRCLLLLLALAASLGSGASRAQGIPPADLPPGTGFAWEAVGDRGVTARDLQFTPDGALWTAGNGVFRFEPPVGPGSPAALLNDGVYETVLVLPSPGAGPDTLFVADGTGVYRSFDRGQTFVEVQDPGGEHLVEEAGGALVTVGVTTPGRAFSEDRGQTWAPVAFDPPEASAPAFGLFALPPAPAYPAGRVLHGSTSGVALSDDGGRTFRPSGLWTPLDYAVEEMEVVEAPTDIGRHVIAGGFRNARPFARAWYSPDDGQTWSGETTFRDVADGGRGYQSTKAVVGIGGASALLILGRGTVYRTDDGGQTWALVGRTPMPEPSLEYVGGALLGPDGRLYVGMNRAGANVVRAWVYRTAAPVVVALEAEPEAGGVSLSVRPNPAGGSVRIVVTAPASGEGVVTVADALGREVARVHAGPVAPGATAFALDTSRWAAGVYVVRASVAGQSATARLVVTR